MTPEDIAMKFVDAINQRDPEAIYNLMTEDHRFMDSMGTVHDGREGMKEGWAGYYKMFPDYQIEVTDICSNGNTVGMFGRAFGTYCPDGKLKKENFWEALAAWKAVIEGDKLSHWQVYADLESLRQVIRRCEKNSH